MSISSRPNALVLFNPVFDNGPDGGWAHSLVKDYWQDISPAHNIDAKCPPAIVFLGDKDSLIPVATAKRFQANMRAFQIDSELHLYIGQPHGFFNESKGGNEIFLDTLAKMDAFLVGHHFLKGTPTEAQLKSASKSKVK